MRPRLELRSRRNALLFGCLSRPTDITDRLGQRIERQIASDAGSTWHARNPYAFHERRAFARHTRQHLVESLRDLGHRRTLGRLFAQHLIDQVVQILRRSLRTVTQSRRGLEHVLTHQRCRRIGMKRQPSGDHLEHHRPERVDIDLRVQILASFALLRRHIQRCSQDHADRRLAHRPVEKLGNAEVEQLHPLPQRRNTIRHHKDVFRLQVAMDDVFGVDDAEGGGDLTGQLDHHVQAESFAFVLGTL